MQRSRERGLAGVDFCGGQQLSRNSAAVIGSPDPAVHGNSRFIRGISNNSLSCAAALIAGVDEIAKKSERGLTRRSSIMALDSSMVRSKARRAAPGPRLARLERDEDRLAMWVHIHDGIQQGINDETRPVILPAVKLGPVRPIWSSMPSTIRVILALSRSIRRDETPASAAGGRGHDARRPST